MESDSRGGASGRDSGPDRAADDHPGLPLTPKESGGIAVSEAAEAGASVAHIHARDEQGRPTAEVGVYESIIEEIRRRCDVVIQVSTGVLDVTPEARLGIIDHSPPRAPMATLNVASMSFAGGTFSNPPWMVEKLAEAIVRHEMKPELEIYDTGHLDLALSIVKKTRIPNPLMFSFVMGVRGGMPAEIELLSHLAQRLPSGSAWQVIGIGRHQFKLLLAGLSLGGNPRVGFEDKVFVRAGVRARDNAEVVRSAAALVEGAGKEVATPEQAREILGVED